MWLFIHAVIDRGLCFQGSSFPITAIQTDHRGIYRCLADNAVRPPAVYDTTVLVDFKPLARAVQSSYGQAENRMFDLTIECTIAGKSHRAHNVMIMPLLRQNDVATYFDVTMTLSWRRVFAGV